eukprot:TRINITY_DN29031_c0_g1_i1.p1 TRINITY_DN29031_c0_g1~~TRINITY_DN29031_c0_g1_i1.p1  ORF type:complete len:664 (-),score=106.19 TRINITY_DN29031_c0_g1_i1:229-2220(-)
MAPILVEGLQHSNVGKNMEASTGTADDTVQGELSCTPLSVVPMECPGNDDSNELDLCGNDIHQDGCRRVGSAEIARTSIRRHGQERVNQREHGGNQKDGGMEVGEAKTEEKGRHKGGEKGAETARDKRRDRHTRSGNEGVGEGTEAMGKCEEESPQEGRQIGPAEETNTKVRGRKEGKSLEGRRRLMSDGRHQHKTKCLLRPQIQAGADEADGQTTVTTSVAASFLGSASCSRVVDREGHEGRGSKSVKNADDTVHNDNCEEDPFARVTLLRGVAKRNNRAAVGLELMPAAIARVFSNIAGLAGLGAGYAAAKLEASLKGTAIGDTRSFRIACQGVLMANGISATVVRERDDTGEVKPWPTDEGEQNDILRSQPLIVANHVSYIDGVLLPVVLNMPRMVSKAEVQDWPFFGTAGKCLDYIWVERGSKSSRKKALQAICEHSRLWKPANRPLALFPEGTTSSGASMLEFRVGAFVAGKPVRPVLIKYTGRWDPSNPDFREAGSGSDEESVSSSANQRITSYSEGDWCAQFVGHLDNTCVVLVCRRYDPSPEEKADARLFADNVRAHMLQRLEELNGVFAERGDPGLRADARLRDWRRRNSMRRVFKTVSPRSKPRSRKSGAAGGGKQDRSGTNEDIGVVSVEKNSAPSTVTDAPACEPSSSATS